MAPSRLLTAQTHGARCACTHVCAHESVYGCGRTSLRQDTVSIPACPHPGHLGACCTGPSTPCVGTSSPGEDGSHRSLTQKCFFQLCPVAGVGGSTVNKQVRTHLPGADIFGVDGGYKQTKLGKVLVKCTASEKDKEKHTAGKGCACVYVGWGVLKV